MFLKYPTGRDENFILDSISKSMSELDDYNV